MEERILYSIIVILAVVLGFVMGSLMPYYIKPMPTIMLVTSTSPVTVIQVSTTTVPVTSIVTTTMTSTSTVAITQVSTITQTLITTMTIPITTTSTVTQSITSFICPVINATTTQSASPILIYNTTLASSNYAAFIANNTLYIYYNPIGYFLSKIRIIGTIIAENIGIPSILVYYLLYYYNGGLLFLMPVNNSLVLAYWNFTSIRILPARGDYIAIASNPNTNLLGALWVAPGITKLIIFRDWQPIANTTIPLPISSIGFQECANGSFIMQIPSWAFPTSVIEGKLIQENPTYIVYPGWRTYQGFQVVGCDYFMINSTLYYHGLSIHIPGAFYAYPNGSLIIAYTYLNGMYGVKVVSLNGTALFNMPIDNLNPPDQVMVFKLGYYYYVIISYLNNKEWLLVYAVPLN